MTSRSRILFIASMLMAVALAACGDDDDGGGTTAGRDRPDVECPISVAGSISLTGNFAQQGTAVRKGYEAWRDEVNRGGGLLGCQVELTLRDDASDEQKAVANYEDFVSSSEVDLLVGPFSSRLVIPTSQVAEENRMLFVEPFGSAPEVFNRGFKFLIYAGPALAGDRARLLGKWLIERPPADRPKRAAYANLDDPFARSITEPIRQELEKAGIQTVAKEVYPEQADFPTLAARIAASQPDFFFGGTTEADAVDLTRALAGRNDFRPRYLALDAALTSFWNDVGRDVGQGIITLLDWTPDLPLPGNARFLKAYRDTFKTDPEGDIAVHSYLVGEIVAAAVKGAGCADSSDTCQQRLADFVHQNTIDTVFGTQKWDEAGRPTGFALVGQWIDGKAEVVLSADPKIPTRQIVPWIRAR